MIITAPTAPSLFPIPSNESTTINNRELYVVNSAKISVLTSCVLGDALAKVDAERKNCSFPNVSFHFWRRMINQCVFDFQNENV